MDVDTNAAEPYGRTYTLLTPSISQVHNEPACIVFTQLRAAQSLHRQSSFLTATATRKQCALQSLTPYPQAGPSPMTSLSHTSSHIHTHALARAHTHIHTPPCTLSHAHTWSTYGCDSVDMPAKMTWTAKMKAVMPLLETLPSDHPLPAITPMANPRMTVYTPYRQKEGMLGLELPDSEKVHRGLECLYLGFKFRVWAR